MITAVGISWLTMLIGPVGVQPTIAAGSNPPCDALPTDSIEPIVIDDSFNGSEDLAFDRTGGLVAKRGDELVRIDADGNELVGLVDGDTELIAEVTGPNGIHAAADGSVGVTAFGGGEVLRVDPDGFVETVVDGAETRNGIIVDESRGLVFYTNYSAGSILRAGLDGSGPGEIIAIDDASLDGLALDACGHLYTVDNANNRLYRVPLNAHGAATDEPVLLAEFRRASPTQRSAWARDGPRHRCT